MGNFRDPLVGRDILYGIILGVIWLLIFGFASILMRRVGGPPDTFRPDYLMGGRHTLAAPLARIPGAIVGALLFFFVFLVLRVLLRKEWLAAVGFVLIWTFLKMLTSTYLAIEVPAWALLYSLAACVLLRYGLIALTLGMLIVDLVRSIPFSSDFSAWYGSTTLFSLVAVIAPRRVELLQCARRPEIVDDRPLRLRSCADRITSCRWPESFVTGTHLRHM